MGIFNPENKFWQLVGLCINIVLLGVLWMLLSLTIVGFGPASTALYYAITKAIRRERGHPFREFFRALKQNWWKSMVIGLLLLLLVWGMMLLDYATLMEPLLSGTCSSPVLFVLALVKLFLLLSISAYIFPILSRFDTNLIKALFLTIQLMFRNLWRTLLMDLLLALSVFLGMWIPEICWLIPGLAVYVLTYCMEPVLLQYIQSAGIDTSAEADPWYLE